MRATGHLTRAVLGVSVLVSVNGPLLADAPPMLDTPAASAASASSRQAPKATLSGKVIAARTGETLAGAELFLVYSEPEGGADQRLVAKTTSAADGSYSFANAIEWPKARPSSERGFQGQCYFLFAVHPDLGMSFACLLPGDRTDNLQVKLFEKKINTVRVVDQDGKPVVGVTVHYQGGGITAKDAPELDNAHRYAYLRQDVGVLSAVTDAQGEVRLAGLYDGCNYSAVKEGFARGYGQTEIPLLPGREVKGQITYADGKPAAGARVKCYFSGERLGWEDYTRADAQGRYRFAGIPVIGYYGYGSAAKGNTKGTITISAELEDPSSGLICRPVSFPAKLDDTQERNVVMTRGLIVGGKIVDDRTGKPLSGITMECYQLAKGQESYDSKTVKTDENGQFRAIVAPGSRFFARWEDSEEGNYVLDHEWLRQQPCERGRYEYDPFQMDVVNADKTDIVLRLRLWDIQPLDGKVVDEQGKPVANAVVHVNRYISAVKADSAGVFTLKTAPKDRDFELCVMSTDSKLATIQKFPAGTKAATITLRPTLTREGIVTTPAGVAADNLKFSIYAELNGESYYRRQVELTTDAKGQFKAEHLIPGAKYCVSWSSDNESNRDYDYGNAEVDLATLKDADPIRFTARKYVSAMMGQVVDPSGRPVPGAKVAIEEPSELVPPQQRYNGNLVAADKGGNFTLSRLADGEVILKATAPGWKPTTLKTATDNVDAKITMRSLAEPTLYRAMVKDAQGKPVAGAAVTLFSQQYNGSKMEKSQVTRKTDVSGVVTFDSPTTAPTTRPVQFSQHVMLCDAPGYDLAVSRTAAAGEDLDAQFTLTQSEKHWKGKVVNSQNQPLAGATIQVTGIRGQGNSYDALPTDEETQIAATRFTSAADGTFELARIPYSWVNFKVSLPCMRAVNGYFDPQGPNVGLKTFLLQQGTSVKGKLVIKGTGLPPVISPGDHSTYVLFLDSNGQSRWSAPLKPDGTFSTEELEAGTYTAQFGSWQDDLLKYVVKTQAAFETKVGETATIVVELEEGICLKGKLAGVKLEKIVETGEGSEDAYGVVSATKPGSPEYPEASKGKVHKDGTWSLYLPEPGEYAIKYALPSADGQWRQTAGPTIKIEPGKTPEDVVITDKP